MFSDAHIAGSHTWLAEQFEELTDEIILLKPSELAEQIRYLPPQVTPLPGYYSFDVAPYIREILDCLDPQSPIREVSVMKGVQVCFTVGVLENAILYIIAYIKNAPSMLLTADAELAHLRMETNIVPMINYSELDDLIKSSDEKNTRKTGKTNKKIEWQGGGFLVPFGAQNANKLRSISIQYLLEDEIDGYPDTVGKDGKPCKLAEDRTAAYELSRKILRGSTPLISQTSNILPAYSGADQRKYYVPCKHCGEMQFMEFNKCHESGAIYGIHWECDEAGILIEDSVLYYCKFCQGAMTNDDKAWMYREGGKHCEWRATSKSSNPNNVSYHLPAFYSPVGMQTWTAQVRKWLECWDVVTSRPKDTDLLQQFYNNVLAAPYEMRGEALKLERVVMHRRTVYHVGEVPNLIAEKETGGKIQFLTCAVDVHDKHLDVQVIGWCPRGIFYSIEWLKLEGDCHDLQSEPWQRLRDLIGTKIYRADDGRLYRIQLTLIDSQYMTDVVHRFCGDYIQGIYPIRGTELPTKGAKVKEFSEFTSKAGTIGYGITTTLYKDRLAAALRRDWDGITLQPDWHPNFPQEYPEQFFKEMTIETKVAVKDKTTGRHLGF
ncbi:MAG: phage terminase large subunit family protein, partial [Deltaproteobacteria bacterium]|nr:phage terminase large subunit family protein [Deltaproteobacteria bacterium]